MPFGVRARLLKEQKLDLELGKAERWGLAVLGFWNGSPYHQLASRTGKEGLSIFQDHILKLFLLPQGQSCYHEN
jgi:hypothetical protein